MADIILNKPEAGTQAVFEAAGDSRIDLNFPTDQATLERSGNDLIFRFDDGSTVVLRDFYTAYTKDSMPDFVIEGTPIAGEQFFTALNEPDLMPAAGPAASCMPGCSFWRASCRAQRCSRSIFSTGKRCSRSAQKPKTASQKGKRNPTHGAVQKHRSGIFHAKTL